MSQTLPASVILRDVSMRDGLQDEAPVPTETKLALFEALVLAGVRELELTSFVRPDRVPAMADADELCAATTGADVVRWGLVLNRRGAERALAAGLTHLQYVVSVSDTHSRHNAGASTDDAIAAFEAIAGPMIDQGAVMEMTLSTAFGCPYEQRIDPNRVVEVARRVVDAGASSIGLADTIGVAIPSEVEALVAAVANALDVSIGAHLHDTRGQRARRTWCRSESHRRGSRWPRRLPVCSRCERQCRHRRRGACPRRNGGRHRLLGHWIDRCCGPCLRSSWSARRQPRRRCWPALCQLTSLDRTEVTSRIVVLSVPL